MDIPYRQLTPEEALKVYCDWLVEQQIEGPFFRCFEKEKQMHEWYMVFYPVRTLLMGTRLLGDSRYASEVFKYIDTYISEQLPNGGFTSTFRKQPTATMTKKEIQEIFRSHNVNIADNGSNVTAIIQAVPYVGKEKAQVYIDACRKWFDEWVMLWALPSGGYANGLWAGEKFGKPHTCGMSTLSAALCAFGQLTGEYEYIELAERCLRFQFEHWMDDEDGRPINLFRYEPCVTTLDDLGHSFYLLEGMTWAHSASKNEEFQKLLEHKLKIWIFGSKGLLSQWTGSWFNFMVTGAQAGDEKEPIQSSRKIGIRLGWEMAKSNGIIHAFLYYLNNIEGNTLLREKVEKGLKYLTHPLKCRASGVMSDPEESYGAFAVQATGFAGLSLAEAISPNSVFTL